MYLKIATLNSCRCFGSVPLRSVSFAPSNIASITSGVCSSSRSSHSLYFLMRHATRTLKLFKGGFDLELCPQFIMFLEQRGRPFSSYLPDVAGRLLVRFSDLGLGLSRRTSLRRNGRDHWRGTSHLFPNCRMDERQGALRSSLCDWWDCGTVCVGRWWMAKNGDDWGRKPDFYECWRSFEAEAGSCACALVGCEAECVLEFARARICRRSC
jgi:hypothetical protein